MKVTIGVFENEEAILEAGKELKAQGNEADNVRIVVKNEEAVPLLAAQTDIPVEGIQGIYESRDHFGDGSRGAFVAAPITTGTSGNYAGMGSYGQGAIIGGITDDGGPNMEAVLNDIGIPNKHTEECERALDSGQLLLIVDGELTQMTNDMLHLAGALAIIEE